MAVEERRAWIMAVVAIAGYAVYVALVLGRVDTSFAAVQYVSIMLWTVGAAIVAGIVLTVAASLVAGAGGKDQRDREIARVGDNIGNSFVVVGAVAALVLAIAESDYFWIANAIYLAFVLSAVLGSVAKIFAYRRGFQGW